MVCSWQKYFGFVFLVSCFVVLGSVVLTQYGWIKPAAAQKITAPDPIRENVVVEETLDPLVKNNLVAVHIDSATDSTLDTPFSVPEDNVPASITAAASGELACADPYADCMVGLAFWEWEPPEFWDLFIEPEIDRPARISIAGAMIMVSTSCSEIRIQLPKNWNWTGEVNEEYTFEGQEVKVLRLFQTKDRGKLLR